MIGFKVKQYLKEGNFSFTDVMNMDNFQDIICDKILNDLTKEQKLDIIWDTVHKQSDLPFNKLVNIYVKAEIAKITREIFLEYLENASISFNEDVEVIKPEPEPEPDTVIDEDIEEIVEELTPLEEKTKTIKELVKANREPMSVDEMKKEGII